MEVHLVLNVFIFIGLIYGTNKVTFEDRFFRPSNEKIFKHVNIGDSENDEDIL